MFGSTRSFDRRTDRRGTGCGSAADTERLRLLLGIGIASRDLTFAWLPRNAQLRSLPLQALVRSGDQAFAEL
jgi:hypothetical protein